jgi:hypothetical protein
MVDLPLIVTRDDDRRFFDEDERERCTDGMLWAEWDAEHAGGVGEMERELRENLFGDVAWSALDPAARRFIATAERAFRDHRADSGFDFAHCLAGYGKAIEVQTNLILKAASARLEPKARLVKTEMRTVDLATSEALPLGQLARAIGGERELNAGLRAVLDHGAWFTGQFPVILDDFVTTARNPGTHATRIDRETATRWRSRMVGVGCEGVLVELAKVKPLRRG